MTAKVGKGGIWKKVTLDQDPVGLVTIPNSPEPLHIEVPPDTTDPQLTFALYEVLCGVKNGREALKFIKPNKPA